jgi:hypothetical protein
MTALGETASGGGGGDTPVERAMEMLSSSLAELIRVVGEGGLGHFDSDGLLEFMRSFERARNQMSVVDHRSSPSVSGGRCRSASAAATPRRCSPSYFDCRRTSRPDAYGRLPR